MPDWIIYLAAAFLLVIASGTGIYCYCKKKQQDQNGEKTTNLSISDRNDDEKQVFIYQQKPERGTQDEKKFLFLLKKYFPYLYQTYINVIAKPAVIEDNPKDDNTIQERISKIEQQLNKNAQLIREKETLGKKFIDQVLIYLSKFSSVQFDLFPQQCDFTIIEELYNNSWRKRYVENVFLPFVRMIENSQELFRNYGIRQSQVKNQLLNICNQYRQVRGDGNCFYTAFGYQFLYILLLKYDDKQFKEFFSKIKNKNLSMKIYMPQFEIKLDNYEIENQLLLEFLYRLQELRKISSIEEREQTFTQHFAAYQKDFDKIDGYFYGLSTIFFRNLANLALDEHEMKEQVYDRQNLLLWETECNNNEIVIHSLARYLKVNVELLFFDQGTFRLTSYEPQNNDKIILLIKPGHYNIGIKDSIGGEVSINQEFHGAIQFFKSAIDSYQQQTLQIEQREQLL